MHNDDADMGDRTWIEYELFKRRWSTREFGRQVGVSATHASRIGRGIDQPSAKLCAEIARVFGMTTQEVMRRAGHLPPLPENYEERTEQRILELMRELPRDAREELMNFAQYLYTTRQNED
jgi:transcriptional regulator with XRE-family HTH domain